MQKSKGADAFLPGTVWLVGAGPGDPGLITLLGAQALAQADVVVHDALVSQAILDMAGKDAVLHYAGKRGGKPSPQQRDISLALVEYARAGKRVLRLKGGDPYLFGRGGEEALTLVEHNIPFRVVPGISAGLGGLAHAGIPLTHRDVNQSVTFITGHDASGEMPGSIDWHAVAKGSQVIVLYMAIKHWRHISEQLRNAGRHSDEPVAFVSNATADDQLVLETTLGKSQVDLAASDISPPAIIVIGDVVRMRPGLDWLGALKGRKLIADPLNIRKSRAAG
jgi:uroporphyrin-III C-methyltransferase